MKLIAKLYGCFLYYSGALSPALLLAVRLWIAHVFWASGILKFNDFSTAVLLFTDEHPVPGLPPYVAAVLGTTFELGCPILLTLGLAARVATVPLLVMTAVINFTYLDSPEHYIWALFLGTILTQGAGKFSLDHIIVKRLAKGGHDAKA